MASAKLQLNLKSQFSMTRTLGFGFQVSGVSNEGVQELTPEH
jgi:hypothetical protein